jgi:predicted GIY-YIG superfamily endonuclease
MFYVYELLHVDTGKKYIGISTQPSRRYNQHARNPPSRMRRDLLHKNFRDVVRLTVLQGFGNKRNAERHERCLILELQTHKLSNGYNYLTSKPGWSQLFWYIQTSRG